MALDENFKIDIDEKAIGKEVPFVGGKVEKALKELEDRINTADGILGKKDGKADIGQLVGLVGRALPLLIALDAAIDFEKAANSLAEHECIKDKVQFVAALKQLGSLAEHAGELFPLK